MPSSGDTRKPKVQQVIRTGYRSLTTGTFLMLKIWENDKVLKERENTVDVKVPEVDEPRN